MGKSLKTSNIAKSVAIIMGFAMESQAAGPLPMAPFTTFVYSINTAKTTYNQKVQVVDLFDASSSTISKLKASGKTVICYFSAGSGEDWRPDYKKIPSSALGRNLDGWAGEKWLDIRNAGVVTVMKNRIATAVSKGCSGIDADNVDGHLNKSGFSLTAKDQLNFLSILSAEAHKKGLQIGLKNSAETAWNLEPLFDFVVVEECHKYKECKAYNAFANKKKAILQIEYQRKSQSLCDDAKKNGATLIFADLALTKFNFCN